MSDRTKNRGELSEIYVFLRLLYDGKIKLTDDKASTAFLDVLSIIREEEQGSIYKYYPINKLADEVQIKLNGVLIKTVPKETIIEWLRNIWKDISKKDAGGIKDEQIKEFLSSIFINKISSPSFKQTKFCGGTSDIFLETRQPATGIISEIGFSIKSDIKSPPTLFNASQDNTNFIYKLTGNMTDDIMNEFNNIWSKKADGTLKITPTGHYEVDMLKRMQYLRDNDIDLEFIKPASDISYQNLRLSGGTDLLKTLGASLKYFYFLANTGNIMVSGTIKYLVETDPAEFGYTSSERLQTSYEVVLKKLLFDAFTGLKLGKEWNGKREISGGYISVGSDGSISAYHSCIEDDFKDFLYNRMRFEKPSASRHKYMEIYKDGDGYFIKLNLQWRFKPEK